MAVFVDAPIHRYGRMVMCHMVADTSEELILMAERIGVGMRWLQHPGADKEHFDVCKSKRALAVAAGAQEVTSRHVVEVIRRKRADRMTSARPDARMAE
jgi:hypothetical protein